MWKRGRFNLKNYIKAIELIRIDSGFHRFEHYPKKGSVYAFELYQKVNDTAPCALWVIHTEHDNKRSIWSKLDMEKAAKELGISFERFIDILEAVR